MNTGLLIRARMKHCIDEIDRDFHVHVQIRSMSMGKDRLGTALRLDALPPDLKRLPIIGRGTTSIVFDAGNDRVILVTRDLFKTEYLRSVLKYNHVRSFATKHRADGSSFHDFPVHVIEMPRLYPVRGAALRRVKEELKAFDHDLAGLKHARSSHDELMYQDVAERWIRSNPESIFTPLLIFLRDYEMTDYYLDIRKLSNYLQTKDGGLVIVDPFIDQALHQAVVEHNRRLYFSRHGTDYV